MSAIPDNVGELTAAVKDKLVQHAEHFKEQNLRNEAITERDKYRPEKYSDDQGKAKAFSYPPESYVVDMLSRRKMSKPHQSVNPYRRYRDCPSYIDPTYYERIELRKKENPVQRDYAMQVMPRLNASDETLDEKVLYLQEDQNSAKQNMISVYLGDRYLFTMNVDYSQEGAVTQAFIDRNSQMLREKIVAMGEYTVEYRDKRPDQLHNSRWQSANIAGYPALGNIPSLTEDFLDEHRHSIVVYVASHYGGLPFYTYNVNQIFPGVFVGEGPTKNGHNDTFSRMSTMLGEFRINTVIAIGPPQEGKDSKFYDYTNGQGKDGWPFTVQTEDEGIFFCYHLNSWLDQKSCENLSQLETALELIRNASSENPVFIHCSAGLGRSGVLVTILYLPKYLREHLPAEIITKLESDIELTINEKDILAKTITEGVIQLREIRPGLIRTEEQLKQAIDMGLSELKREVKLSEKASAGAPLFLNMRFLAPPADSSSGVAAADNTVGASYKPPGNLG